MADQVVKTYPGLSSAALKCKDTLRLRAYYALRHYDQAGAGWVMVDDAVPWLMRVCGLRDARYIRRLLGDGGRFWVLGAGRVWLTAMWKVLADLGAVDDTSCVLVPLVAFGHLRTFRASLYGSGFVAKRVTHVRKGDDGGLKVRRVTERRRITRGVLTDLTGVGKTTQRRWEGVLGGALTVTGTVNLAVGRPDPDTFPDLSGRSWLQCVGKVWSCGHCSFTTGDREGAKQHAKGHRRGMNKCFGRPAGCGVRASVNNRAWLQGHIEACHGAGPDPVVAWQGPNVFESSYQRGGARWCIKRARRTLKGASEVRRGERPASSPSRKVHYWDPLGAYRALERGKQRAVYLFRGMLERHGQRLYAFSFVA